MFFPFTAQIRFMQVNSTMINPVKVSHVFDGKNKQNIFAHFVDKNLYFCFFKSVIEFYNKFFSSAQRFYLP